MAEEKKPKSRALRKKETLSSSKPAGVRKRIIKKKDIKGTIESKAIKIPRRSIPEQRAEERIEVRIENLPAQSAQNIAWQEPPKSYHGEPKPEFHYPLQENLSDLPGGYGDNRIVLLVRDPHWIFAYWEIQPWKIDDISKYVDLRSAKLILRVYDVTSVQFSGNNANSYFDIEVTGNANNWYIKVPGAYRDYLVDIGFISSDGRFFVIARSNAVKTPRDNMSDEIDAAWMTIDFEKLYLLSGGYDIGRSSGEINELLARRLKEMLFSGGISSFSGRKK